MGMGHAHDHDPPRREVEAAAVRRVLATAVALVAVGAVAGLAIWWPGSDPDIDRSALGFRDRVEATVSASKVGTCGNLGGAPPGGDPAAPPDGAPTPDEIDPEAGGGTGPECVVVTAEITSGASAGENATLEASTDFDSPVSQLAPGDAIVLNDAGDEVPPEIRYSFADMQRSTPLAVLAGLFALVVVALGRLRGLLALAGIGLSMAVLLMFIFPALLGGAPPVAVAVTGATVIAFGTLYLAHGVNDRTTVALLGTLVSLAVTAALAAGFSAAAELTGLASEESLTLLAFAPGLDFRGLLLAAVIIGTLGVLDDVTITQVSAVWELKRADPALGLRRLYAAGIRIGRDHIASTVNTLVLAYSAAALPLLLIYTQSGLGFGDVLTTETVAVEIVQTLVGSIGLVASVPITTGLACWVITRTAARADDVEPAPGHWPPTGGWDAPPRQPVPPRRPGRPPQPAAGPRRAPARPGRRPPPADDEFWHNKPW
ncbi:MAG TPA: YibE/F family protein [Acidimicrobiales bacterium]